MTRASFHCAFFVVLRAAFDAPSKDQASCGRRSPILLGSFSVKSAGRFNALPKAAAAAGFPPQPEQGQYPDSRRSACDPH